MDALRNLVKQSVWCESIKSGMTVVWSGRVAESPPSQRCEWTGRIDGRCDILGRVGAAQRRRWSRRAERKAEEVRRKRDIHVSFCQSEGFRESRKLGKWAKWKAENVAQ